jgi:hypothetical protein
LGKIPQDAHFWRKLLRGATFDADTEVNRETLAPPRVDDRQAFQPLAIRARVDHEIVGPHVISRGGRHWPWAPARDASARPASWHLQLRLTPEPMRAVGAHRMPGAPEEDPNPPIAVARVLRCERAHDRHGWRARPAATHTPRWIGRPTARRTRGGGTGRAMPHTRPAAGARVRVPFFQVISLRNSMSTCSPDRFYF